MNKQEVILKFRKRLSSCQTNQIAFVIFVWTSYINKNFDYFDSVSILEDCLGVNFISDVILKEKIQRKTFLDKM